MFRLLVSLGLALLLYGRTLGFPLIRPVEATGAWLGGSPLVEATFALDRLIGGGADWSYRLTQVCLLALLGWVASGAVPRGTRRALVLLLVVAQPMLMGAVMDPVARGELLLALAGTVALTTRGPWTGLWTLVALAAHPLGSLVPLLGLWMPRGQASGKSRVAWRVAAVLLWWIWRAAVGGVEVLGDVQGWTGGLRTAAVHAGLYARQLLLPMEPIFARTLPPFSDLQIGLSWVVWGLALGLGLYLTRRNRSEGAGAGPGLVLVALPLLIGSAVGEGATVYGEARLAWPVVGLAWILAAAVPLRMAAFALVPLCLGVTGIRAGDHANPVRLWERVHQAFPEDGAVKLSLAHALVETEPSRAAELLETALLKISDPAQQVDIRRALVRTYVGLEREPDARPHLAVLADPESEESAADLELRCLLAARYGDAVWDAELASITAVCAAVVARAPSDVKWLEAAGVVAVAAGAPREGRAFLTRAVELAPDQTRLRQLLANVPLNDAVWHRSGPVSSPSDP